MYEKPAGWLQPCLKAGGFLTWCFRKSAALCLLLGISCFHRYICDFYVWKWKETKNPEPGSGEIIHWTCVTIIHALSSCLIGIAVGIMPYWTLL